VQVLFIRSVTITAVCVAIGRRQLVVRALTSPVLKLLFLRNLLLLTAWLSYYTAARTLSLPQMTTLYYAAPIIITLLAAPILKEEVSRPRWAAVIIGFIGVLIASNPEGTSAMLTWPVWLALQAAIFWAFSTIILRKTSLSEDTLVQMAISSGLFVLFCGVAVIFTWTPASGTEYALMGGLGIIATVAQFTLYEGLRRAPASLLAPFEYTSLVWAFVLGFAIWGDIPSISVFVGAFLIITAGIVVLLGERMKARRRLRSSSPTMR
jgi:drug/metabolite transporter (DMT)-like permease